MTHEVTNQPPPLSGINAWRGDPLLVQLAEVFSEPGRARISTRSAASCCRRRRRNWRASPTPRRRSCRTHDRQGRRIDLVEFHPAYHALMRRSVAGGLHSSIWENGAEETGKRHQVRAARFYLTAELECGHLCPITMTSASLAALMASPKLFREWAPRITTRKYDQTPEAAGRKGRADARHGHDREAGRHRCARQHRPGPSGPAAASTASPATNGSCRRRCRTPSWCWRRRSEGLSCFLVPRLLGDGDGQRLPLPAAEGQARQPLQRLVGGRVRRRHRRDGRRARRRHQDHHGHGDADPARLRRRLVGADAGRAGRGGAPCAATARCSASR